MIFFPIRTSNRPWRTPYANYLLIAANVVIFALTYWPHVNSVTGQTDPIRAWAEQFMLTPARPFLWQFVSYAFLHGSWLHILGNMFFLYLFGNNVNDKLGHIGYMCFYLAGAVFSGIGHSLLSSNAVLGASGAIAAVTGAYLVLFPQTLITVFFWILFWVDTWDIPALYFIGFKMIVADNIIIRNTPDVAYDAHLSGYAIGILTMVLGLASGIISRSNFDLWAMMRQWNRRRQYRDIVAGGYDPFAGQPKRWVTATEVQKSPDEQLKLEKIIQLRDQIAGRVSERNLSAAAELYLQIMAIDPSHLLPQQHLLDIANQLESEGRHELAAKAYEQFLANYGSYQHAGQIELMLGILYSRYIHNSELAIKHLVSALGRLSVPDQIQMCQDEITKLRQQAG